MGQWYQRREHGGPEREGNRVCGALMRAFLCMFAVLAFVTLCAQEAQSAPLFSNNIVARLSQDEDSVEEEAELSGGVMQDGRLSVKRSGGGKFFRDKSWNMFASNKKQSSYGLLGKTILSNRRHRNKLRLDWAFSDTDEPSGVSIMGYANQKRVLTRKRSPTRYNEDREDRDRPRISKILNPSFRSFRGAFRGKSVYQRYAEINWRRKLKQFYKIANVDPKTGRFKKDDDDGDGMYSTFSMTSP